MVNINIEIPDEIHKKAKLKSVIEDVTLKDFIIKALEEKLENKNKK